MTGLLHAVDGVSRGCVLPDAWLRGDDLLEAGTGPHGSTKGIAEPSERIGVVDIRPKKTRPTRAGNGPRPLNAEIDSCPEPGCANAGSHSIGTAKNLR